MEMKNDCCEITVSCESENEKEWLWQEPFISQSWTLIKPVLEWERDWEGERESGEKFNTQAT